jgi:hypothetical protein
VFPQNLEPFHLGWHLQRYCKMCQKLALNRDCEYKSAEIKLILYKKIIIITGDQTQFEYKNKGKEVSNGNPCR